MIPPLTHARQRGKGYPPRFYIGVMMGRDWINPNTMTYLMSVTVLQTGFMCL